jgi:hypothetical protein
MLINPCNASACVKVYQIRGRRSGRKQAGLHKQTTPTNEGWKALYFICVVLCFNFSSK